MPTQARAAPGFFLPDDEAAASDERPTGTPNWQASDVKCALAALKAAGVDDYRIEFAPDGTITIVVGQP